MVKSPTKAAALKFSNKKPSFSILRCLLAATGGALCCLMGNTFRNMLLIDPAKANTIDVQRPGEEADYPQIDFSVDQPIFSLSLPNTGMAILPRYFDCAGHAESFGRYWTSHGAADASGRRPIGQCLRDNLAQNHNNVLQGCGEFAIWHDLQYRYPQEEVGVQKPPFQGHCFDPVLFPGALEQLHQAKPNATIFLQIKDPAEWYKTLSYDLHYHWNDWCNPTHNNLFPTEKTETAYLNFYEDYHQRIRNFITAHPSWTLIELELAKTSHVKIASRLQHQLGIPAKCWRDSVQGTIPVFGTAQLSGAVTNQLERPNNITYPILVVSLPKSGTSTTEFYFKCNLGHHMSNHQWTKPHLTPPFTDTPIGECFQANLQQKMPPLHNCGVARVFSDVGSFDTRKPKCYYPQLHGGLPAFAEAYPYATILLAVRNATEWVQSARGWANLNGRWANCPECQATGSFPPPGSPDSQWVDFYDTTTRTVREFAMGHPTLTYIEVPLTDDTGPIMDHVFGYPQGCFGHANDNKKGNAIRTRVVATG